MARSFRDPNTRVPNFGVEGAIPKPPWWADIDRWRVVPPPSPPWSPPPSIPRDGPDPFGHPPRMPAPLRPSPKEEQAPGGSDLLDWLFGPRRAGRGWNAGPLPTAPGFDEPAADFFDRRPWRFVQPDGDRIQTLPFDSRQLDALLRHRPE